LHNESFSLLDEPCCNAACKEPTGPKYENVKILMADDEEFIRSAHIKQLSKFTSHIATCNDGLQALNLYKEKPQEFDLVILDGYMPHLDGINAVREIRRFEETEHHLPAKLMSMV